MDCIRCGNRADHSTKDCPWEAEEEPAPDPPLPRKTKSKKKKPAGEQIDFAAGSGLGHTTDVNHLDP